MTDCHSNNYVESTREERAFEWEHHDGYIYSPTTSYYHVRLPETIPVLTSGKGQSSTVSTKDATMEQVLKASEAISMEMARLKEEHDAFSLVINWGFSNDEALTMTVNDVCEGIHARVDAELVTKECVSDYFDPFEFIEMAKLRHVRVLGVTGMDVDSGVFRSIIGVARAFGFDTVCVRRLSGAAVLEGDGARAFGVALGHALDALTPRGFSRCSLPQQNALTDLERRDCTFKSTLRALSNLAFEGDLLIC
jgi:hypothetical protein